MSFDFEIKTKPDFDLNAPENELIARLINAYIDLYNFSCNKIIWYDVKNILQENRDFLESKGIIINATDHKLETLR